MSRIEVRPSRGEDSLALEVRIGPRARRRLARTDRALRVGLVVVPSALALVLSLIDLSRRSLWLDEAATVSIASQHGHALGAAMAHDGGNMLAYYGLIHLLIAAFGDGEFVIRLPSALAAAVTVGLVVAIGERLFDKRSAFAAGVLCAVSLPLVYWAQNARAYVFVTMFVAASFYAFLVLAERAGARSAWGPLAAYVAATTLAMYCSYIAALEIAVQLLVLPLFPGARRRVVLGLGISAACCAPLAALALARGTGQLAWLGPPTPTSAYQLLELVTSSGLQPNFSLSGTGAVLGPLTVALVLGALARLVRDARDHGLRRHRSETLVLAWVLVPIALATLESYVGQSIFTGRNVIGVLPAVALVLGALVMRLPAPPIAGWCGLALLVALRAVPLAPTYGVSPEPWRAATAYLVASSEPGDCVAFFPLDVRMPVTYYLDAAHAATRSGLRPVWPTTPLGEVKPFVERYDAPSPARLDAIHRSCRRLWLITSHDGQRLGSASSEAHFAEWTRLRSELSETYSFHHTEVFGWASLVRVEMFANIPRLNYGRSAIPT